jgi:hypothetical protein
MSDPPYTEVAMFEDKARVLLILPQQVLDRARVFAGESITRLKAPVSLQMVLRALIDEGLKRDRDRAIVANIEGQMQAVRAIRRRGRRPAAGHRTPPSVRAAGRRGPKGRVGVARHGGK